jgi:hypothetical protein
MWFRQYQYELLLDMEHRWSLEDNKGKCKSHKLRVQETHKYRTKNIVAQM